MNWKYPVAACIGLLLLFFGISHVQKFGFSGSTAGPIAQPFIITVDPVTGVGPATTTQFFGNVDPIPDAQYSLGQTGHRWLNGDFSGMITVGSCSGCGGSGSQTLAQTTALGATTTDQVYLQGGIQLLTAGNISNGGTDALRTLVLSSAGGWPTLSFGAATATQVQMTTNRENYQLASFQPGTLGCEDWTAPMPDAYDGGTLKAKFYWTSTSTATFNNVSWTIKATSVTTTGALDATWGATSTVTMTDSGGPDALMVTTDTTLTIGGTPNGTKLMEYEVCRPTSVADTATTTANLLNVELKYGINHYSD